MTAQRDSDLSRAGQLSEQIADLQLQASVGGPPEDRERQHGYGRLTARERVDKLIDEGGAVLEIGQLIGIRHESSEPTESLASVITAIGPIHGQPHLIIADDSTINFGIRSLPTIKKTLRAQRIALENRLPVVYLIDSLAVVPTTSNDIFPQEDNAALIFHNHCQIAAAKIPQYGALLGNCFTGGDCWPWQFDNLLVTDDAQIWFDDHPGRQEYQTKSATDALGSLVNTACANDVACLDQLRSEIGKQEPLTSDFRPPSADVAREPLHSDSQIYDFVESESDYDVCDLLQSIVDRDSLVQYKAEYGKSIVCATAKIAGITIGIVANQHHRVTTTDGHFHFGGIIYVESAEKAARFVMSSNQNQIPLLFLQDVNGFMVGRESEHKGIIKAGAKLVNAVSNSRVPKITVLMGGSFGAGNYAMCGKAFDPRFIFAWPHARCAVMGSEQATSTLTDIAIKSMQRQSGQIDEAQIQTLSEKVKSDYDRQTDIRYAASRGWVDALIDPAKTRDLLQLAFSIALRNNPDLPYRLGVFQV